jgi:hypothetical protein
MAIKRQQFCGDTLNLFGQEDQNFHWSRSYWYYSSLPLPEKNENKIWTSGISLAGCVPEVFDCKEVISWCVDKFIQSRRVIQLHSESPISLAPSVFRKMLKLPEPTITFKGDEARNFLKEKNNGLELLQEYLEDPTTMPEDISRIQVNSLKNPYRELAWLFTRLQVRNPWTTIPRLALYILYFTIHEEAIFDWGKIISSEISTQLSNFKSEKKFYMASYLIFSITYYHVFKGLSIGKRVNCKIDPITMWYQGLWRQKFNYYFYEVYNEFVSLSKNLFLERTLPDCHEKH